MRRSLALLSIAALVLGVTATTTGAKLIANAAASCSGSVTEKINATTIRARSISTRGTSCANGRAVIRSLLKKAERDEACNRASKRPPPTRGCGVRGLNCSRNASTYCASPGGREVSWRE